MEVDWVTVAAQLLNFLVLVWLLHRFLYGPLTRAMQRREERIRNRIADADAAREAAEADAARLEKERRELEERREALLREAREEAKALEKRLESELREEVAERRAAWLDELREERADFLATLREQASEGFRRLADDALRAMADEDLASRLARAFLAALDRLDEDDAARLARAAQEAGGARVVSSAPLDETLRERIGERVRARLGDAAGPDFETDADGPVGVVLRSGGETLAWTLDAYLDRFAEGLDAAFRDALPAGSEDAPDDKTEEPAPDAKTRQAAEAEAGHD